MLLPQLTCSTHERLVMVMVMSMMVPDISGHTTCTAITTVYNTSVTCLFGEDISKLSFNVQFFFPNTSADPEMTLLCNKLLSGELTCHKGSQVLFDEKKKIVDRFTLSRPPSLAKLNGGYYQCHAVPSLRERSQVCPLTYKDVRNFVPLESQPRSPKVGSDAIQTFTMVAVVVILILFIVMIIAGVYLWTKRKSVFQWWSKRRHKDVEDAKGNDESTEMSTLSSGRQRHMELSKPLLLKYDKDLDEDEGGERDDTTGAHRSNPQSPQRASQNIHPTSATSYSHQHPSPSPVHPETQPSHFDSVRVTSMPPCRNIEDPTVETGTDALEDKTLTTEEHEARQGVGEHRVGDEIETDEKAKKKKEEADEKARKKKEEADKKAKKKTEDAAEKANKKKKAADEKAKKDENRDRRGSQREKNVMHRQESSNVHETHTVV